MSEDREKEIIEELKKVNQKLDKLQSSRGVSTPVLYGLAIVLFLLAAPLMIDLFVSIVN